MSVSSTSFSIFIIITILYFIIRYNLDESVKSTVDIIYYCLFAISQLFFIYIQSKELCKEPQIGTVFIWGLIPIFFIFFGMITLLKIFPGWKSPFSNTFGYLTTRLMGIGNTFNSLLKTNFKSNDEGLNKVMQSVYEDQSLLINEITPSNFDLAIQKLKPMFNTTLASYGENIEKLKSMVNLKDEVSRFIWYVLTGGLVISISNMGAVSSKCEKSPEAMKREMDKYNTAISKQSEKAKQEAKQQQKSYIRD